MIALAVPEILQPIFFCDGRTDRGIGYSSSWIIWHSQKLFLCTIVRHYRSARQQHQLVEIFKCSKLLLKHDQCNPGQQIQKTWQGNLLVPFQSRESVWTWAQAALLWGPKRWSLLLLHFLHLSSWLHSKDGFALIYRWTKSALLPPPAWCRGRCGWRGRRPPGQHTAGMTVEPIGGFGDLGIWGFEDIRQGWVLRRVR